MPLSNKYIPDWPLVEIGNKRELYGIGGKKKNSLAMFHKYPHLLPKEILQAAPKTESCISIYEAPADSDFRPIIEAALPSFNAVDEKLLLTMTRHWLKGETITPSVEKKVFAYLREILRRDFSFRSKLLGGQPRTDADKFAPALFAKINANLTATRDTKIFRQPVHVAVNTACQEM